MIEIKGKWKNTHTNKIWDREYVIDMSQVALEKGEERKEKYAAIINHGTSNVTVILTKEEYNRIKGIMLGTIQDNESVPSVDSNLEGIEV